MVACSSGGDQSQSAESSALRLPTPDSRLAVPDSRFAVPDSPRPAPDSTRGNSKTILFLGTSLTAGYGLDPDSSYPAIIQRKIDAARLVPHYVVRNAGFSGETSAGARRRIEWLLNESFDIVVIESGANDGLRGVNVDSTRANLQGIIDVIRARRPAARIVIAGMEAPRNMGREYTTAFAAVFRNIAAKNSITLIPFLLEGVAGVDSLNQTDGIHPNGQGARIVAEVVWRVLGPLLRNPA